MTTVALIPTYQPDCRLLDLVEALRARGVEGVVVDDGSGMRYRPLFKLACRFATVIGYGENHGKGHALKQGLRYIQQHYPEDTVVVTVDADGQHDPADVLRCAQEAQASHDTMVLGCRSFEEEGVPLRSRLGNKLTREVYHLVSGACVSDTQTGLRAFPAALISFLVAISGERYEYEMNVLLADDRGTVLLSYQMTTEPSPCHPSALPPAWSQVPTSCSIMPSSWYFKKL